MSTVCAISTPPEGDKLLLNAPEAARRLSISTRKLWSLTASGDLPHVRIGRRVLYRPSSLDKYLDVIERWQQDGSGAAP